MSKLSSKNLKVAYRCLLLDGMDPEIRRKYIEARLPIENYQLTELSINDAKKDGIKLGKQLGIELGMKVSLLMTASNMLLKYSDVQAVQVTGLSLAEVASLRTLSRSDAAASPARPCRRSHHARVCPGAQRDPDSLSIELSPAYLKHTVPRSFVPDESQPLGDSWGGSSGTTRTPISSLSPEQPIAPHSVAPDEPPPLRPNRARRPKDGQTVRFTSLPGSAAAKRDRGPARRSDAPLNAPPGSSPGQADGVEAVGSGDRALAKGVLVSPGSRHGVEAVRLVGVEREGLEVQRGAGARLNVVQHNGGEAQRPQAAGLI